MRKERLWERESAKQLMKHYHYQKRVCSKIVKEHSALNDFSPLFTKRLRDFDI